jgi:flagellar hook-associated protein 1 FlgK
LSSLNGIMTSALTALQTNSTALNVVSNNVANLNTPNYARRVVNQETLSAGGTLAGVAVADIQRVVDQFLSQESLQASAGSAQYDAQATPLKQLNGILGQPGDGTSLSSQLDNVFAAIGQAALAPTASASQLGIVNAARNFASTVSTLSGSIGALQTQVDQQIASSMSPANNLIKQIYDLNNQIQTAMAGGDTASALLDQRDTAIQSLSQLIGIRTVQQPNGSLTVMTQDGVNLVGDSYAQLTYAGGGANGVYGQIGMQQINPSSGLPIGPSQALDPHLSGGSLKGMIDMRDQTLGQLQQELGTFAQQTALSFNKQHNANVAFPPPTSLTGRNTGLLATDGTNFTGVTTIGIADQSGALVGQATIDFGAGTISVNGGAATSFSGSTLADLANDLNTALGSMGGSASFSNGVLSLNAGGSNGLVIQDDPTTPANRGGVGFSQFFGLNDMFQAAAPSILSTGLTGGDAGGFAAGGRIDLQLKGPSGDVAKTGSITLTGGETIGNIVSMLNTAMNGAETFALNADGSISETTGAGFSGYALGIADDTTQRGSTGISFTKLFGMGIGQDAAQAQSFSLNPALSASPQRLALAQPQTTISSAAIGATIVGHGDSSGALALQTLTSSLSTFPQVGALGAQNATISDYAAAFYQDIATRSQTAQANQTAQDARYQEAQTRLASTSGVNLDEELSNMMTYQKAYSASARILTTVDQLYDTLLQMQ